MNESRLMKQILALFGVLMTIFYIGFGLYFALFNNLFFLDNNNKNFQFLIRLFGFTIALYGIYRGYRTYLKISEAFFSKNDEKS
jgi:hypothetical protein